MLLYLSQKQRFCTDIGTYLRVAKVVCGSRVSFVQTAFWTQQVFDGGACWDMREYSKFIKIKCAEDTACCTNTKKT